MYNISQIWKYLTKKSAVTYSCLHSGLPNFFFLFSFCLPNCSLIKLQSVQNACARLIFTEGRYCHITPLLIKLYWLPIQSRIVFKILLLTFKVSHGTAPTYLESLISLKPHSCYNLRHLVTPYCLSNPASSLKRLLVTSRLLVQHQNSGMHCHLKSETPSR